MDAVKRQAQLDLDHDILFYVRDAQALAPVTEESVFGFVVKQRRRKVTILDICDRLNYLTAAKYLDYHHEWKNGDFVHYTITADGMDLLDGNIPPRDWKP